MKRKVLSIVVMIFVCTSPTLAANSWSEGADINHDGIVDFKDFAIMANNWLLSSPGISWVDINDPGIGGGHEGFVGEMSQYQTTSNQYCQFLNEALDSGDIYINEGVVYGSAGSNSGADFPDEPYFVTYAAYPSSLITYFDGVFSVPLRDGLYMGSHPVVQVSWYGATAFCNYYGWRLPTEWEWQAVADYDGSYTYGCGTTVDHSKANYDFGNPLNLSSPPYTNPVDYYPPYGYGMNDMAGNAWDWTSSVFGSSRVLRGGSWGSPSEFCSASLRFQSAPNVMSTGYGFRVCR